MDSCCESLASFKEKHGNKKWFRRVVIFLKLLMHLLVVMIFLMIGAACFMEIEDPAPSEGDKQVAIITKEDFAKSIALEYQLNLSSKATLDLLAEFESYLSEFNANQSKNEELKLRSDRSYTFTKWFYFTNIVATTIGKTLFLS